MADGAARLPQPAQWLLVAGAALMVSAAAAFRLPLLESRGFNPDEFEHLHAAWCVARGQVPYRDFFEHHPPVLYFATAPLLARYDLDGEVTAALDAIFSARRAMWLFAGLVLVSTAAIGRVWRSWIAGLTAAALLTSTAIFLSKALEFRPDVPATALWMGSLFVAALARTRVAPGPAARWWALSGLLSGTGVVFTQKLLFGLVGPSLAVMEDGWRRGRTRASIAGLAAGAVLPCVLIAGWFAWRGALAPFVEHNLLLNARWMRRSAWPLLAELAASEPLLLALALAGVVRACRPSEWRGSAVGRLLLFTLAGVSAGLLALPVVHRQYALLLLPLLALFAGAAVTDLLGAASRRRFVAETLSAAMVLALALVTSARLREAFARGNTGDLENIRYVLRNVSPRETVLDGFTGQALFRPHAFFYFFLHGEVRAMLPAEARTRLLDGLRSGTVAPKVVLLDTDLREFSPEVARFVEENYAPLGREPLRGRLFDNGRGVWRDEAPRRLAGPVGDPLAEPHLFIEEGWQRPQAEAERRFRRSRGRRSHLLVPVKTPGPLRAVVLARAETPPPVRVELRVNGASAGCHHLSAGWREYAFTPEGKRWKAGLNDVTLRYLWAAADAPDPGIAVETLRLERLQPSADTTSGSSSCAETALPAGVQ